MWDTNVYIMTPAPIGRQVVSHSTLRGCLDPLTLVTSSLPTINKVIGEESAGENVCM